MLSAIGGPRFATAAVTAAKGKRNFVVMLAVVALSGRVESATMTVTTTDDELNSDGDTSLREAINQANASSELDEIILPAGVYTLTIPGAGENNGATGDLDIKFSLAIIGEGSDTTMIDGAGLDRVFHHTPPGTGVQVTLNGVTIRNGDCGSACCPSGAICGGGGMLFGPSNVSSALDLVDVVFLDNRAASASASGGGLHVGGTPTLQSLVAFSAETRPAHGAAAYRWVIASARSA